MKNKVLSNALRAEAENLADAIERNEVDVAKLNDVAELIRVLARIVEGKTIDKAFGAPGDWGYDTPIGDGVLAMLREPDEPTPLHAPALEWHYSPELPDDDCRVLFAAGDGVEVGHHENGHWLTTEEAMFDDGDVYAWAHLPNAPEPKKGGAS